MCCVGIVSIHGFGTGRARRLGGGSRFPPLPVVHDEDDDVIRCGRDAAWSCCGVRLLSGGERTAAYTPCAWACAFMHLCIRLCVVTRGVIVHIYLTGGATIVRDSSMSAVLDGRSRGHSTWKKIDSKCARERGA